MTSSERFDPDLLELIRAHIRPGEVITTLSQGRPNRIESISSSGLDVITKHSLSTTGGSSLAPAWMFNEVWRRLQRGEVVSRDELDRTMPGRKVKRSSIVFAVIERLPNVEIARQRPLALRLRTSGR